MDILVVNAFFKAALLTLFFKLFSISLAYGDDDYCPVCDCTPCSNQEQECIDIVEAVVDKDEQERKRLIKILRGLVLEGLRKQALKDQVKLLKSWPSLEQLD